MEAPLKNESRQKKNSSEKVKRRKLDIDSAEESLWLVKVPQFVAEKWATANSGDVVGTLSLTAKPGNPKQKPEKKLEVILPKENSKVLFPEHFTLEEVSAPGSTGDNFLAFSSQENNKGFKLTGKVTKNLSLRPSNTPQYRQWVRDRGITKIISRRETQLADSNALQESANQSHVVEFISSDRMEMKRKAAAERVTPFGNQRNGSSDAGTDALRSRIFEAFQINEKQLFKDIMEYCQQQVPGLTKEKDLRELLEKYAKYHLKGTYKHFWELKPEYRDHFSPEVDGTSG